MGVVEGGITLKMRYNLPFLIYFSFVSSKNIFICSLWV